MAGNQDKAMESPLYTGPKSAVTTKGAVGFPVGGHSHTILDAIPAVCVTQTLDH